MLKLKRKECQSIHMQHRHTGEVIRVVVCLGRATVGIDAGDEWRILREELVQTPDGAAVEVDGHGS